MSNDGTRVRGHMVGGGGSTSLDTEIIGRRVGAMVQYSSTNTKVPGSIPGPGLWIMMRHVLWFHT